MSNSLSNLSTDLEEELVTLYATLVDEDNFEVEDDQILPEENFLKNILYFWVVTEEENIVLNFLPVMDFFNSV